VYGLCVDDDTTSPPALRSRYANTPRVERVRELIGALGDHDGDGLADVAHDVAREHRLSPRAPLLGAAVRGRHVRRDLAEVRGVPGEDHAGQGARGRGVHLGEPRVGLGAPDDAEVQRV
jgi:hypothetical protein